MASRGRKALTASQTRGQANEAGLWAGFSPPDDMRPAAVAEFNRIVLNLRRVGTLDRTDPQIVLMAADTKATLDEVNQDIRDEGRTIKGGLGQKVAHPLLVVSNSLTIRLRGLFHDMGLTASSSKHGSAETAETPGSKWGDLLSVTG